MNNRPFPPSVRKRAARTPRQARACGHCLLLAAGLLVFTALPGGAKPRTAPQPGPAAELQVVSDPEEALVSINREERGTTPLTIANLPPGEHLVILRKRGYRDHHATVTLSAQTRRTIEVHLEPVTALAVAGSEPAGATVTANGVDLGVTPLLITTLPPGTHRLRFSLPGFQPTEREVVLDDRTPVKIAVTLTSDSVALVVSTDPPGATVSVNGIPRGVSPCTIERIPEGESVVEIHADGYLDINQQIKLAAGESHALNLTLRPRPARIRVTSLPPGSRVYLDNQYRGETPLTLADLDPGDYRLRLEQEGFDPLARTVTLARGAETTEEFRLTANTGSIRITTTPADVEIFIAGKRAGKTVAEQGETTNLSNPLVIGGLRAGAHTIKFVRQGWAEKTLEVTVERDQTLTRHVILDRLFIPDYEVITVSGTVFRGVFDAVTDLGVSMETAPGVMTVIPLKDIRRRGSLRDDADRGE